MPGQVEPPIPAGSSKVPVVRSRIAVQLILIGLALVATTGQAQVLQSSADGGQHWLVRDSGETRLSGPAGAQMRVNLPPGDVLSDLEPTPSGWLAAVRIPSGVGTELLILEGRDGETDLLGVPARAGGTFRGQPVVMLEQGHLVGLVWAEGNAHDQLAIWAASLEDGEWGQPELVSPPGPGSQLAPKGVVLGDRSWLAIWPAFDGTDDEIRWSRRVGGQWSPPQRVHADNDVPDLLPDVIAIDGGALVAWSWFDGNDYRLRTARLIDGGWSDFETIGEKGSVEAGLVRSEDGIRLLYQTVMPATWTVLELDSRGMARRTAVLRVDTYERPLLLSDESGAARLVWPALENRLQPAREHPLVWQQGQP